MELNFRFATASDADLYFRWVNNPQVRANSFRQDPVAYSDHVNWFNSRLASGTCFFYLFFNAGNVPVGQVRIEKGKETIIDISVDEDFRGKSYSKMMLAMACRDFLEKQDEGIIFSYIKKSNPASYRTFLKSGFRETFSLPGDDYHKLYLRKRAEKKVIDSFEKVGVNYEIILLDNLDIDHTNRFFELFYRCFGKRDHLDLSWFDWFYNRNPYGPCNNYALIDRDKNRWVGVYGLAKSMLVDGDIKQLCGVGVNGMIDNDYRNQGLYADLMRVIINNRHENDIAVSYPHGLNRGSAAGHYKAGWELLKKPEFYKTADLHNHSHNISVREIFSFIDQPGMAELLIPNGYASWFEKTPEWLQWRFFSRPHKKYHALAYIDASEKIKGYVILGYYKGALSRCQLLDYNACEDVILASLINGAKQMAVAQQCDELDLWLDDSSKDLPLFMKNGFNKTSEFYELLVFSKNGYNFDKSIKTVLADLDAV